MSNAKMQGPVCGYSYMYAPNETLLYRVVSLENPLVSPFPDHTWVNKWQAEKFARESAPNGWAARLIVVP